MRLIFFLALLTTQLFASGGSFLGGGGNTLGLSCANGQVPEWNGAGFTSCLDPSGAGTVTSVGAKTDSTTSGIFVNTTNNISGSPVTAAGNFTFSLATQNKNKGLFGPTTGSDAAPTFRLLVGADLPLPAIASLGGVFSKASASHNFLTSISSVDGSVGQAQPAFPDISGQATLAQLPSIANNTILGNNATLGVPIALTVAQINAILPVFSSSLNGLVPASGGGTTNFLRADGTFAAPSGGSGVTTVAAYSASSQTNGATISSTNITFGPADATNPGMVSASGAQTLNATLTLPNILTCSNTTDSTSVTTGAIVTGGGIGATKGLFTGGTTSLSGGTIRSDSTNKTLGINIAGQASSLITAFSAAQISPSATVARGINLEPDFAGSGYIYNIFSGPATHSSTTAMVNFYGDALVTAAGTTSNMAQFAGISTTVGTNNVFLMDVAAGTAPSAVTFPTGNWFINQNGSTTDSLLNGNLRLNTAGKGLQIKTGSNARAGTSTLTSGTVTVSNSSVTSNTIVLLTIQSLGTVAAAKAIAVTARTSGTSFTITSADATDTSVIGWMLVEPL